MIQNTQIISGEIGARFSPIAAGTQAIDSIIYFDAVEDDYAFKSAELKETKKQHGEFFAATNRRRPPHITSSQKMFLQSPRRFPSVKDEPKRLFGILLIYLDRIIYLDEMSKNLKKLDAAIKRKNTNEINLIAYDCADICIDCGMSAAIAPLLELERIEDKTQMTKAADLTARVKREFDRCTLAFKKSLQQLAAAKKFSGYISI